MRSWIRRELSWVGHRGVPGTGQGEQVQGRFGRAGRRQSWAWAPETRHLVLTEASTGEQPSVARS
ncbi:MAG TPA: hypothetical protein VGP05_18365 [Pseudonocardia sp.]|nr:hypothetical protein [Pseudonocardia sp.]